VIRDTVEFCLSIIAFSLLLGGGALAADEFENASVIFEQNATDGDAEVVINATAGDEGLAKLKIVSPDGRALIDFTAPSSNLGIRHFALESPEPDDDGSLRKDYPEGKYAFFGTTVSGGKLVGEAMLSHRFPKPASILVPKPAQRNVPVNGLKIEWSPTKGMAEIVVVVEQEETGAEVKARLPGSATMFSVPDGFLRSATEYKVAVGTVAQDGNASYVEAPFKTAGSSTTKDNVENYPAFDVHVFNRSTTIDNVWFPLQPGKQFVFNGTTVDEEGDIEAHSIVFTVTDVTKVIDGVRTRVCWERDFIDGELEEAEIVFFAQADDGAVWHFGQYPEEYSDGKVVVSPGWLHGVNGHAGIHMPANPRLGDPDFAQGWAPTVPWTDKAVVHEVGRKVKVPTGAYDDVLVIDEYNLEEADSHQLKYYAKSVGLIKVGWLGHDETQEVLELVEIRNLNADSMAKARDAVLKLEKSARKRLGDIFGTSEPIVGP